MTLKRIRIAGLAALLVGVAWTALSFWQRMPASPPPGNPEDGTGAFYSASSVDVTLPIWSSLLGFTLFLVTTTLMIFGGLNRPGTHN